MRYYGRIRFGENPTLRAALNKVNDSARDINEAKAFITNAGNLLQGYIRDNPGDSKTKEAIVVLKEAHKKAELSRLLLIQAMQKIDAYN